MYWLHELLDMPTEEPPAGAGGQVFDHYYHYTWLDPNYRTANFHYVSSPVSALLPLKSLPWPNATPRTRLGASSQSQTVATDLFGCHGTSGSGVLQKNKNGTFDLLGPVIAGGNWVGTRLCTGADAQPGQPNVHYLKNATVRQLESAYDSVLRSDRRLSSRSRSRRFQAHASEYEPDGCIRRSPLPRWLVCPVAPLRASTTSLCARCVITDCPRATAQHEENQHRLSYPPEPRAAAGGEQHPLRAALRSLSASASRRSRSGSSSTAARASRRSCAPARSSSPPCCCRSLDDVEWQEVRREPLMALLPKDHPRRMCGGRFFVEPRGGPNDGMKLMDIRGFGGDACGRAYDRPGRHQRREWIPLRPRRRSPACRDAARAELASDLAGDLAEVRDAVVAAGVDHLHAPGVKSRNMRMRTVSLCANASAARAFPAPSVDRTRTRCATSRSLSRVRAWPIPGANDS